MKAGKKKGKYTDEMKRIDELTALNKVLKRGTIENALLTNAAKESDSVSDSVIDSMLDNLHLGKTDGHDVEIVEHLTTTDKNASIDKRSEVRVKSSKGGIKLKRSMHLLKKRTTSRRPKQRKR